MTGGPQVAAVAVLGLLLGLWLMRRGRGMRRRRGLGEGRTITLDNVTLTSRRYKEAGATLEYRVKGQGRLSISGV